MSTLNKEMNDWFLFVRSYLSLSLSLFQCTWSNMPPDVLVMIDYTCGKTTSFVYIVCFLLALNECFFSRSMVANAHSIVLLTKQNTYLSLAYLEVPVEGCCLLARPSRMYMAII